MTRPAPRRRSKTVAAWLALLGGAVGLHRFYLHGAKDRIAWLHPLPTALGSWGVWRLRNLGQDDPLAWMLVPVLGLMLSQAMLTAIVIGLTPDARWDARHNAGVAGRPSAWGAVFAAVLALFAGGIVLLGTIAYAGQKFFEWQLDPARSASAGVSPRAVERPAGRGG